MRPLSYPKLNALRPEQQQQLDCAARSQLKQQLLLR